MTAEDVSDEMLMAYVDGELNAQDAEAVARAVAAQPAVARRLDAFIRSKEATQAAFAGLLASPPPERLIAAVLPGRARSAVPPARRQLGALRALPLAASLLIGIGLGAALWGTVPGPPRAPSGLPDDTALLAALARQPSGTPVGIGTGTLTVAGTYPTGEGTCRTFSLVTASGQARGVGCTHGQGWKVELLVAAPASAGTATPASDAAASTVEAFLDGIGAAGALSPEDEAKALSRQGLR